MPGIPYMEIIATLTLLGAIVGSYVTIQVRISKLEAHVLQVRADLDKHEKENREDFRQAFLDNKEEFRLMHEKLDKLISP